MGTGNRSKGARPVSATEVMKKTSAATGAVKMNHSYQAPDCAVTIPCMLMLRASSGGVTGTPASLPTGWRAVSGYLVGNGADLTGARLALAPARAAYLRVVAEPWATTVWWVR